MSIRKSKWSQYCMLIAFVCMIFLPAFFYFPKMLKSSLAAEEKMQAEGGTVPALLRTIDGNYKHLFDFGHPLLLDKGFYVNLYGWQANALGRREANSVFKLGNGHLTQIKEAPADLDNVVEKFSGYFAYFAEAGIDSVYIQAPHKISKYDPLLPAGIADFHNEDTDAFLAALTQREPSLHVLDLRESIHNSDLEHYDLFQRTDHHPTPEASFWAYTECINFLHDRGLIDSVDASYLDIENYHIDTYPRWALGSCGRRVGQYYGGIDDFSLIYPKWDTNVSIEIPRMKLSKTGAFEDVLFAYEFLIPKAEFQNPVERTYSYYQDLVKIRNDHAVLDKRVLLIGDSFFLPIRCFLSSVFSEIDTIDVNLYSDDIVEYAKAFDPDLVLVMLWPGHIK